MRNNIIHKITVYKLLDFKPDSIDLTPYFPVKNGEWRTRNGKQTYWLYFYTKKPENAGWFAVFEPLKLGISPDNIPKIMVSGFIMIIRIGKSFYGLTGGIGHIQLRKRLNIEHRFGIELAVKIIGDSEITGLSQKDTSGEVVSLDRIFRGAYNPQGDFSNLKRILSRIRGKLNKGNSYHKTIGRSITASDALTVSGSKNYEEIIGFLEKVDAIYSEQKVKTAIPGLQHIDKKRNSKLYCELELKLIERICTYNFDTDRSLFLDNGDTGYLPDRIELYKLHYRHMKYEMATYEEVYDKVKQILNEMKSVDGKTIAFNKMKLEVRFDDGTYQTHPFRYYICGDLEYNNEIYFIYNQRWFKANVEYIDSITTELNQNMRYIPPERIGLKKWVKGINEDQYNKSHRNMIVLHKRTVGIGDQKSKIEFCDLLNRNDDEIQLIHVKRGSGAALRELFSQGAVSARLFAESNKFQKRIYESNFNDRKGLSKQECESLKQLANYKRRDFTIVYAIYDDTHKVSPTTTSTIEALHESLTLFAKVDLVDRVTNLRAIGYDVAITRIRPYPR